MALARRLARGMRHVMLMQSRGGQLRQHVLDAQDVPGAVSHAGHDSRRFGEFHPLQMPRGRARPRFRLDGFRGAARGCGDDVAPREAGLTFAFNSYNRVAVLLGQRLLGARISARCANATRPPQSR